MKAIMAIGFAMLLLATVVIAQQPAQPPMHPHPPGMPADQSGPQMPHPPPPQDPLAHLMFPPDMILNHARELNLTDEQKAFMRSEVQKATATFQELQWKLQDQTEALHEVMKSTSVNEQQALAQLDKVLEIEREIKRLHIGLAVRLKNRLTPEQQEQLHNMRMDHDMRMPGPDGNPPGDLVQPPIQ
jgi:Spy/CpxP family protein refolding chaperone